MNKGKPCGFGAYFADDPERSADFADQHNAKVNGLYCVFEVKLNPVKTKIPEKQTSYRIIEDPVDAASSAICVHVEHSNVASFG